MHHYFRLSQRTGVWMRLHRAVYAQAQLACRSGETVLVIGDEPNVRILVTEILENLGYIAIEASDGAAGLRVLQSDVGLDLLVTDVGLPGVMNGRQMADAARMTRTELKVLFTTGYAENAVLSQGRLDPGMHVLMKPFAMETLASQIKVLILNKDVCEAVIDKSPAQAAS